MTAAKVVAQIRVDVLGLGLVQAMALARVVVASGVELGFEVWGDFFGRWTNLHKYKIKHIDTHNLFIYVFMCVYTLPPKV